MQERLYHATQRNHQQQHPISLSLSDQFEDSKHKRSCTPVTNNNNNQNMNNNNNNDDAATIDSDATTVKAGICSKRIRKRESTSKPPIKSVYTPKLLLMNDHDKTHDDDDDDRSRRKPLLWRCVPETTMTTAKSMSKAASLLCEEERAVSVRKQKKSPLSLPMKRYLADFRSMSLKEDSSSDVSSADSSFDGMAEF